MRLNVALILYSAGLVLCGAVAVSRPPALGQSTAAIEASSDLHGTQDAIQDIKLAVHEQKLADLAATQAQQAKTLEAMDEAERQHDRDIASLSTEIKAFGTGLGLLQGGAIFAVAQKRRRLKMPPAQEA